MEKLIGITTPYGDKYIIDSKGRIMTKNNRVFSNTWIFRGIHHVRNIEFIPFELLTAEYVAGLDLLYKNGNPQYTGCDKDHGTCRMWSSSIQHGIKSIIFSVDKQFLL